MRFPIVIEPGGEDKVFGVAVPDLPGCFSAGDTLDEAVASVAEAAAVWIDAALDAGDVIPAPSSLEAIRKNDDYAGWTMGVVDIDMSRLDDTTERVNITLPRRVLRRLDEQARAAGESRSGYIAKLALAGITAKRVTGEESLRPPLHPAVRPTTGRPAGRRRG